MRRILPVLPRLGPVPRGWWPLGLVLFSLLPPGTLWFRPDLMPGRGDFMDGEGSYNIQWEFFVHGLAHYTDDRHLMYPIGTDRVLQSGLPLDGLLMWPWVELLGPGLGWTAAHAFLLAAAGLANGWLCGRWWRSGSAALIGGLAVQLAGMTLREVAYGRPTQVYFLVVLPLMVGLLLDAVVGGRPLRAVLAGVLAATSVVSWWYAAVLVFAVGLAILALAIAERLPVLASVVLFGGGLGALSGPVFLFVYPYLGDVGGLEVAADGTVVHGMLRMRIVDLLAERSALQGSVTEGAITVRPLFTALLLVGILAPDRLRRRLLPALLVVGAAVLGLGPFLTWGNREIVLPFAAFLDIPLLRRFWWPDRMLLLIAPAVALLAARGVLGRHPAVVWGVAGGLLVETWIQNPWMPLPQADAGPSEASLHLAEGQGPALLLPFRGSVIAQSAGVLRDVEVHGRPLFNGYVPADASAAPPTWAAFADTGILRELYLCEITAGDLRAQSPLSNLERLGELGVTEVVMDEERFAAESEMGRRYLSCVSRMLGVGTRFEGGMAWTPPAPVSAGP